MPKSDLSLESGDYVPVATRITLFYARHPTGRILTELISRSEREVMFKALVFRASDDRRPSATGWASERPADGEVNAVACLENTETSAIGRALANLGFLASAQRPSLEEMQKVARARSRARVAESAVAPSYDAVQRQADAITDVLRLLAAAERAGLQSARAVRLRERLVRRPPRPHSLARLERVLRQAVRREHRQAIARHRTAARE